MSGRGTADTQPTADIVQPYFQDLHHGIGRVALGFLGHVHVTAELLFHHAVMEAELLLFAEANTVLGIATTTIAVHAGEGEFFASVLLNVGDRNANTAGEADLRSGVTAHETTAFHGQRWPAQNMRREFKSEPVLHAFTANMVLRHGGRAILEAANANPSGWRAKVY